MRKIRCDYCGRESSIEFGMVLRCHWCDRAGFFAYRDSPTMPEEWPPGVLALTLMGGYFSVLSTDWDTQGESHAGHDEMPN